MATLPSQGAAVDSNTLMNLINQERTNRNLVSLFTHKALLGAATQKSQDMIDRDYFAHVDPDGNYVWPKIVASGYSPYRILGENLAVDFSTSEGIIQAWLDSPTHRANLLHPEFVDQGLTALYGDFQGRYTNLTTSLFGALATTSKTQPRPKVKAEPIAYATPYASPYASPHAEDKSPAYITPPYSTPYPSHDKTFEESLGGHAPRSTSSSLFDLTRLISTLFGLALLIILAIDSVIIYRRETIIARSRSSYHLFGFMLIVLISILIWYW